MYSDESIREIVDELQKSQLAFPLKRYTYEELLSALAAYLTFLITSDFSRLIFLLYRLDISEKKLKDLLSESTTSPAGAIIAKMIIERQLQKIESRKRFQTGEAAIPEDEKW